MTGKTISTWELFKQASNEDIDPLVGYLKEASLTEWLTVSEKYKKYAPDHSKYISEIYDEICLFGGNTFANLFRGGKGPAYKEVLEDAAKKAGVKDIEGLSIEEIEEEMIQCLLRKAIKEARGEDLKELRKQLEEAGLKHKDYSAFVSGASLATLLGANVFRLVMAETSAVIANAVAKQVLGHSLRLAGGAALGRLGAVLAGPIGWAVAGLWMAVDIAGPAFRVTIPCTIHIGMLRQQWICQQRAAHMEGAFDD